MHLGTPPRGRGRFHLAIPVHDLKAARAFYGDLLGCSEGRARGPWIDWDFFGHQLVTHQVDGMSADSGQTAVDGKAVPVPHFGILLDRADWELVTRKLTSAGVDFIMEPTIRFADTPGEQGTCFLRDPSGNALEFKAFADDARVFAKFEDAHAG